MSESVPEVRPISRRATLIMGLGCIVTLALLLALGTWQVQRLAWKEELTATIQERVSADPRPFTDIETRYATTRDVDYWPVSVSGTFRHDRERHYLATWRGQSGFHVLTPLELADGRFLFVNRGFVPYDRKDAATRPEGQIEGEVEIVGLARSAETEKPSFIVPDNDPAGNVFFWKDIEAMAGSAGLGNETVLGFLVDAGDAPNPGGLPVGGVTRIDLPNNHLQYAITWYGLALTLVIVAGAWVWRNRRSHADRRNGADAVGRQ